MPMAPDDFKGRSIFNALDGAGISWKVYGAEPVLTFANEFAFARNHVPPQIVNINQYYADMAAGTLPQVAFVDPLFVASKNVQSDEHPPSNVQVGQKFTHDVIQGLMGSTSWNSSALFLTYDEHGGYFDHVPPPAAPLPSPDPNNTVRTSTHRRPATSRTARSTATAFACRSRWSRRSRSSTSSRT